MFKFYTLDNFDFSEKVVGVRVDINSPIIKGKVIMNERIQKSTETLKELIASGAKIVLMAHQGRKGKKDFVSLKSHLKFLKKILKLDSIGFLDSIELKEVSEKVSLMKSGEVLMLENLRFFDEELNMKTKKNRIIALEEVFDYFVFDAFSVSHREQSSVVGFTKIPMIAGRLMEKELLGLNNILDTKSPHTYFFGGAKPDDLIDLMEISLKNKTVDSILLAGVIGEVALHIKGFSLGCKLDFLKEHNYLSVVPRLNKLLNTYSEHIFLPKDVVLVRRNKRVTIDVLDLELPKNKKLIDKYMINDIGSKTLEFYDVFLKNSGSIYFKGPAGNFEEPHCDLGTKGILKSIVKSEGYSFLGGGHSVTAAYDFGVLDDLDYVSLAGGALVKFISGKTLPGVESLENSFTKFDSIFDDFVVMGSNVIDENVSLPMKLKDVELGDKIRIGHDFSKSVGGGGINVSICLSRLKAKTAYLGKLSYDSYDLVKEDLDKNGVTLIESKLTKRPSAKSILLDTKDNDRVIFTFRGQNSYLEFSDFNLEDFRSNYYYLTSLQGNSFLTQIKFAKEIKKRNPKSVFCYSASSSLVGKEPKLKQLVRLMDIIVLNFEEAQILSGKKEIDDCLKGLKELVSNLVIITDGSNGSYAYDGNKKYFVKAKKAKFVDSTGAGDSYCGTFFYFYAKGFGIKKAMEFASINASCVVSHMGAHKGLLDYDVLIKSKLD